MKKINILQSYQIEPSLKDPCVFMDVNPKETEYEQRVYPYHLRRVAGGMVIIRRYLQIPNCHPSIIRTYESAYA